MSLEENLERGIAAAKAGNKREARRLLKAVVKADENQLEAWLWLSRIVDSLEEREICLENVLTLDPANAFAQKELARVRVAREAFFQPAYQVDEAEAPAEPSFEPVEAAPETVEADERLFDNEWLCPYCLALTEPKDKQCPSCRQPFVFKRRIREERTVWLWRSIFLQLTVAFFTVAIGAGVFTLIVKLNGVPNPIPYLPAYLGLPVNRPASLTEFVLMLFPRWVFWGLIAFSGYSFLLMVLLYLRVTYGNVLYLISGIVLLVLGIFSAILYYSSILVVVVAIVAILLGAAQLWLSYNLWDDFTIEQGRIRLRLDRDAKTGDTFFMSARKYIKLKMWGMALIHAQQAAYLAPKNVNCHATLALAFMRVNRYKLAQRVLKNIESFAPDSHELWELRQELNKLQNN